LAAGLSCACRPRACECSRGRGLALRQKCPPLNYCRSLKFADKPDYSYLRKMFKDLFFREGYAYDHNFDWTLKNQSNSTGAAAQAPSNSGNPK